VVQPRDSAVDEWARFQKLPAEVHAWADKGKAKSSLRPGSVDSKNGGPHTYRDLMTTLPSDPYSFSLDPKDLSHQRHARATSSL
jgi:hypothetical protein